MGDVIFVSPHFSNLSAMKKKIVFGLAVSCVFAFASSAANNAGESLMTDSRDGQTYKTAVFGNQLWMAQNLNYNYEGSSCYEQKDENCQKQGRLYDWSAAAKVCPDHWHLPSLAEMESMIKFAVGVNGLSLSPTGLRFGSGEFDNGETHAYLWTSSAMGYGGAAFYLNNDNESGFSDFHHSFSLPVRCVNDSSYGIFGYMTDSRDARMYKTIDMGEYTWMADNLEHYMRGSFCYGGDCRLNGSNGLLYTFEAAQKVCPAGWELPTKEVANRMLNLVDEFQTEFLPVAAGLRTTKGQFLSRDTIGYFWVNSESGKKKADYFYWSQKDQEVKWFAGNRGSALSVRCVKKNQDVKAEQGSFLDPRDQRTYKTVKIGRKTWFAENLNFKTAQSLCYENNPSNCEKYGRLYNFEETRTACPAGWHNARLTEFSILLDQVAKRQCSMNCLYGQDKKGACVNNIGLEQCKWFGAAQKLAQYGFSTEVGGVRYSYVDEEKGGKQVNAFDKSLIMWGATYKNRASRPIQFNGADVSLTPTFDEGGCYSECESNFYSVRCVMDE